MNLFDVYRFAMAAADVLTSVSPSGQCLEAMSVAPLAPNSLAAEAVATAGAWSRQLSWSPRESNGGQRSQAEKSRRQVTSKSSKNKERKTYHICSMSTGNSTQELVDPRTESLPFQPSNPNRLISQFPLILSKIRQRRYTLPLHITRLKGIHRADPPTGFILLAATNRLIPHRRRDVLPC